MRTFWRLAVIHGQVVAARRPFQNSIRTVKFGKRYHLKGSIDRQHCCSSPEKSPKRNRRKFGRGTPAGTRTRAPQLRSVSESAPAVPWITRFPTKTTLPRSPAPSTTYRRSADNLRLFWPFPNNRPCYSGIEKSEIGNHDPSRPRARCQRRILALLVQGSILPVSDA